MSSIAARIEYLKRLITSKKESLKKAPPGSMQINSQQNRVYYDYIHNGARRLKASDPWDQSLARDLAQKKYDEQIEKCAEAELKLLTKLQAFYRDGRPEDIYGRLHPARRDLVTPITLSDEEYAEHWQAQKHKSKPAPPAGQGFMTERDEIVRSKSEVFLANMMLRLFVRYHYEVEVMLVNHLTGQPYAAHPDFLVLNARTRKEYYFEHFGKMGDPEYARDALNKLIDYANAGIFLGDNLIATFESGQCPLTPETAELIIRHYLL